MNNEKTAAIIELEKLLEALEKEAHPFESGRHDLYGVAMDIVGRRHAKGEIVSLVNAFLYLLAKEKGV